MIIRVKRMTVMARILHWVLASSVVACFVTGLFIAVPFWWSSPVGPGVTDKMMMGYVRLIHFGFAMALDVAFIIWFYLFFFSLEHPFIRCILPLGQRFKEAMQMLRHYFTLKHKPPTRGNSQVDPLNAYGFLLIHFLVLVQMITGFSLMAPTYSASNALIYFWVQILQVSDFFCLLVFQSQVVTRQVHHLAGYAILAMAMVHVYVQIWREHYWTEGHISVVVSGFKYIHTDK